jgi:hypothetical protein
MLTLAAIDPMQPYGGYNTPLAPQGAFGNFFGGIAPTLGGLIGGAFGNQGLGTSIGQGASPLLRLLPFQVDPMTAAYASGQLAPQGAWGNFLGGIAPTLGGLVGGTFGNPSLGATIGQGAAPLLRLLPFGVDPMTAGSVGQQAGLGSQAVLVPQNMTDPEVQAANHFVQDAAGAVIRRLHEFLQQNIKQYAQLADAIPLVQRAAELYEARDFARAYAQAYQAYRAIGLVRSRHPDMPNP